MIEVKFFNHAYCKVICDRSIAFEIKDAFSFRIDNYKFHPLVKQNRWDGIIKLYNLRDFTFPVGLIAELKVWAEGSGYNITISPEYQTKDALTHEKAIEFFDTLNLKYKPRDYQIEAFIDSINSRRKIVISPTGSGKSLIMYLLTRWLLKNDPNDILIIVPTTALVYQLCDDFKDYGWSDFDEYVHPIADGSSKNTDKKVVISTWQALQFLAIDKKIKGRVDQYNSKYFERFGTLIGDEAHTFKADSLKGISDVMTSSYRRIGLSGTLSESLTNEMVLKGIFGPIMRTTYTSDLIADGTLSDFKIRCLNIQYPKDIKEIFRKSKLDYQAELDFIYSRTVRNNKLALLALSQNGNTAIIFRHIEKHGKLLYDAIKAKNEKLGLNKKIYFYSGEISGDERNEIRKAIEEDKNAIIIGSIQTFSTGINIVNLDTLIFASPQKSQIKVLQSIGRILRQNNKTAILYDISDDLRLGKYENYAYKHFVHRLEIYVKEGFDYELINMSL